MSEDTEMDSIVDNINNVNDEKQIEEISIDNLTNIDDQQSDNNHNDSSTTTMNEPLNNDQDIDQCSMDSYDSDDDDCTFIDNMLEENVDIEAIKRCEQVKRKLDDLDVEDQVNQTKQSLESTTTVTNNNNTAAARVPTKTGKKRAAKSRIETKQKNILVKRGHDLFEILPEGWVEITHFSGMPIYLDKRSRVCTLSKPYYLGSGSARKHHIPLSAIPCLQYRNELEKERKAREEMELKCLNNNNDNEGDGEQQTQQTQQPIAKVETLEENKKERSLDSIKVREYCRRLFEFKTITVKKFTNWADRRKHEQLKKIAQRPSLPESTKLITCTIPKIIPNNNNSTAGTAAQTLVSKPFKKEFIMNPMGKSDICILHEYVQHTERTQPKYIFEELENVSKPYCATVFINDMEYGKGYGSSKKEAKTEAARISLDILIPDLKNTLNQEQNKSESSLNDLKFFDTISIEDQRVSELCLKAGQYSPYQILVECIKRLYGFEDLDIKTDTKIVKHHKIEFKMTAGTHEAIVICKNKREGKQRAAQKILKSIHPQLNCWGALLKLYGQGSCKTSKEKKEEAQKITELQNNACSNKPNYAILNKLKEEMLKLHDENGKQQQQQQQLSLPAILNATVVGQCGKNVKNRKEKFQRSSQNL